MVQVAARALVEAEAGHLSSCCCWLQRQQVERSSDKEVQTEKSNRKGLQRPPPWRFGDGGGRPCSVYRCVVFLDTHRDFRGIAVPRQFC